MKFKCKSTTGSSIYVCVIFLSGKHDITDISSEERLDKEPTEVLWDLLGHMG